MCRRPVDFGLVCVLDDCHDGRCSAIRWPVAALPPEPTRPPSPEPAGASWGLGPVCSHGLYQSRCQQCGAEPLNAFVSESLNRGPGQSSTAGTEVSGGDGASPPTGPAQMRGGAGLRSAGEAPSVLRGSDVSTGERPATERLRVNVDEKCPKCGSPSPELHPALQWEGEVQPCADPWHGPRSPYLPPVSLTFADLRAVDVERCNTAFGEGNRLMDWTPSEWACALAGEVGEACNFVKKMRRAGPGHETEAYVRDVAKELADVVIYADLLAARLGIDLGAVVVEKFNEVSKRVGSPVLLPPVEVKP